MSHWKEKMMMMMMMMVAAAPLLTATVGLATVRFTPWHRSRHPNY
jgi:hypothetical protein